MDESPFAEESPEPHSHFVEEAPLAESVPLVRRVIPLVAAVVICGAALGYAVHERHAAQNLAAQNAQTTAQLASTRSQLDTLGARVNSLAAAESKPSPAVPAPETAVHRPAISGQHSAHRTTVHRPNANDLRFQKLQSEVDEQDRQIEAERGDLTNTRTELSGSIARTHDELVVLEKKGERNYYEFDIYKSKEFRHEGPVSLNLHKANEKHQYADLQLIVDDRTMQQKHVNLYQPVTFYQPESQQPIEVIINQISKNHIHGYISAPKYRASDLAAASTPEQPGAPAAPPARQKLTLSSSDLSTQ